MQCDLERRGPWGGVHAHTNGSDNNDGGGVEVSRTPRDTYNSGRGNERPKGERMGHSYSAIVQVICSRSGLGPSCSVAHIARTRQDTTLKSLRERDHMTVPDRESERIARTR